MKWVCLISTLPAWKTKDQIYLVGEGFCAKVLYMRL